MSKESRITVESVVLNFRWVRSKELQKKTISCQYDDIRISDGYPILF